MHDKSQSSLSGESSSQTSASGRTAAPADAVIMEKLRQPARSPGWRLLDPVRARLGREDLTLLPTLDEIHDTFVAAGDVPGCLLASAYAVQAIAAAYADFRQASRWVHALRDSLTAVDALSPAEQLVVRGAEVSAAVIVDTGAVGSPGVVASLEQALQLLALDHGEEAANDVFAVARALLEYSELQADADTFHRVAAAVERKLPGSALGDLIGGRYRLYHARCMLRHGVYDLRKPRDPAMDALLMEAEALAQHGGLDVLHFDIRYARVVDAAIRNQTDRLASLLEHMHEVLDYTRPNSVALYHQHKTRMHLMRDEVAPAFEAARHALAAGTLAACGEGELRGYRLMHALAMMAGGHCERAIAEVEAVLPAVSGRTRVILQCTVSFAHALHARAAQPAQYAERLRAALREAEELNWPLFLNSLPGIAAQLCADGLRLDCGAELCRRAILLRNLAPPGGTGDEWPWPVRLYALGRFAAYRGNDELTFSGHAYKQVELLKLLVVCGNRGRNLSWFAEMLWPDSDGDFALRNLEVTLNRVRKILRVKDAVVLRNHILSLNPRVVWTDFRAFEIALADCSALAASQSADPTALTDVVERILRFYEGDLLPAAAHAWLEPIRDRARRQFVHALDHAGQALQRLGHPARALVLYERGLAVDGLAEELFRGVIACEQQLGNRAAALQAYKRCVTALRDVLHIEPSRLTRALVDVPGDPESRAGGRATH